MNNTLEQLPSLFHIYAQSDASRNHFYNNKSNDFSNHLFEKINPEEYMVALCELYYGDHFVDTEPQTTTTESSVSWFSSSTANKDNKVIIGLQAEKICEIIPKGLNMLQLLTAIDNKLREQMPIVQIKSLSLEDGNKTVLIFRDNSGDNYQVELQNELSLILGFTSNLFESGQYTSHNYQNNEALQKYENLPSLYIRIFKWSTKDFEIQEPNSNTDLEELLGIISDQLALGNFHFNFVVSPDGRSVHVELETPRTSIQLPNKINELLGKPKSYVFTKSEQVVLPIVKQKTLNIDVVEVLCNLVSETQKGEECKQIIRVFERQKGLNKAHFLYFSSLQFHTLRRKDFSNIQITLTNGNGELLPISKYPTTALLQFKKI